MSFYLFLLCCIFGLFLFLRLKAKNHAPFLILLFSLSFLARLVVGGYFYSHYKEAGGFLSGDEVLYFYKGLEFFNFSKTTNLPDLHLIVADYKDPHHFPFLVPVTFVTILHYLIFCFFSVSLIYTKITAIFVSSLAPIFFYFVCLKLFDQKSARLTSILFSFWPAYFYHSVGGFREPYLILFTVILLQIGLSLFEKTRWRIIPFFIPLLMIHSLVNRQAFPLYVFLAILFVLFKIFEKWQKPLIFILIGLFAASPLLVKERHLHPLIQKQLDIADVDDAGYFLYPYETKSTRVPLVIPEQVFQRGEPIFCSWLFIFLKGLAYALFSPFLWDIQSKPQLMAYPQILFMMLGFLFLLRGTVFSVARAPRFFFPITFILLAFLVIFSLTEGNIGAAFRHRELFLPCYLLFFSVGFLATLHRRAQALFPLPLKQGFQRDLLKTQSAASAPCEGSWFGR